MPRKIHSIIKWNDEPSREIWLEELRHTVNEMLDGNFVSDIMLNIPAGKINLVQSSLLFQFYLVFPATRL